MKQVPKRGTTDIVFNNCGLGNWHGFFKHSQFYDDGGFKPKTGGADWCLASFRNNPDEKEVYDWIKSKYPIVFQSPVRKNRRTGNQWFFIIFDTKKQ